MRYLILSDIHANREALEAVAAKTAGRYERLLCLGDMVGYGADPAFVIDWLQAQPPEVKLQIIRGNHDKAAIGQANLEWFNPAARKSALWTQTALSADHLNWLRKLPQGPALVEDFWICHGSPLDEDQYLVTRADVEPLFGAHGPSALPPALFFFGHTHRQGGFLGPRQDIGKVRMLPGVALDRDVLKGVLDPEHSYLINPGAVGQPRDRDPRAAYAFYDTASRTVTYERVPYAIGAAQDKIRTAGLPHSLAARLAIGR